MYRLVTKCTKNRSGETPHQAVATVQNFRCRHICLVEWMIGVLITWSTWHSLVGCTVGRGGVLNKNLPSWSQRHLMQHHCRYAATAVSTRYYCTVISRRFGSAAVLYAYAICSTIGLLSDSCISCGCSRSLFLTSSSDTDCILSFSLGLFVPTQTVLPFKVYDMIWLEYSQLKLFGLV